MPSNIKTGFQSLFSWNLPSDTQGAPYRLCRAHVSILVFLELALGPSRGKHMNKTTYSFNPCFLGTCPRTTYKIADISLSFLVSILVFLELALGLLGYCNVDCGSRCCFNPCFLGTCPRTFPAGLDGYKYWSFNPCFLGTCPRTQTLRRMIYQAFCFNPCFLGTCPRTE